MLYRPHSLATSLPGKSLFMPEDGGGLLIHPALFVLTLIHLFSII
jgi:hypothetical protein